MVVYKLLKTAGKSCKVYLELQFLDAFVFDDLCISHRHTFTSLGKKSTGNAFHSSEEL